MIYQNVDKSPELNTLIKNFIKHTPITFTAITRPEGNRGKIICDISDRDLSSLLSKLEVHNIFPDSNTIIHFAGEYSEVSGKREFVSLYLEAENSGKFLHLGEAGANDFSPENLSSKNERLSRMRY